MPWKKRLIIIIHAVLFSIGLMVFSFFIQYDMPVRLVSLAALLVPAVIIGTRIKTWREFGLIIGEVHSFSCLVICVISGIIAGILLSMYYRWHLDISLLPKSFHLFVITAALIGSMEELVFRGFLQGYIKSLGGVLSVLISTISHTGYKCCLFLSPAAPGNIDISFLAFWTFCAGIVFGTVRHQTKSLFPSLVGHAVFDILVYAEFTGAPWWVW